MIDGEPDQRFTSYLPIVTIDSIIEALNGYKIPFAKESEMQRTIEKILKAEAIPHYREFAFNPKDRIDFLVGKIGIECKVDGSKHAVARQLLRYAEQPEIESLLLITSRATHTFPSNVLLGKEFRVYRISGL